MTRVLIVSASGDVLPLEAVRALGDAGIHVHVLGAKPRLAGTSRYCHRQETCPPSFFAPPYAGALQLIEDHCRRHHIDVVMPAEVESSVLLASIAPGLRAAACFPVSSAELILELNDKWRFAQLSERAGVPHPKTRLMERPEQFDALDLAVPAITKPLRGAFGEGIVRLRSRADIDRYLARGGRDRLPVLVQDFIPGRDVCISVLADHGSIVAFTIQEPAADAMTRNFLLDEKIRSMAEKLIAACGYHGLVHIDMRRDERDGSVRTLEANPRVWASLLYSLWMGVNFAELGVKLALEGKVPPAAPSLIGPCRKPVIRMGALAKHLLGGRTAPAGLPESSARAWEMTYGDPLPQIYYRLLKETRRFTSARRGADAVRELAGP